MNFSLWDVTPHRQRVEWTTRDSINQRQLTETLDTGAKKVTSAMLVAHPTHGAYAMIPTASQKEPKPYRVVSSVDYFPDGRIQGDYHDRPKLPPKSLFQNPWLNDFDIENGDVIQELKGVVKENNLLRSEDVSKRIMSRTFTHQWIPQGTSYRIVNP
jgi:hypothetical protein